MPLAIDELPVLFIAAACAHGETVVTGAEELRVKESDRIAAMSAGFRRRSGVAHEVLPDGMRIEGRGAGPAFGGGEVDSFGDHRIAMSFTIASLRAARPSRFAMWRMWPPRFRGSSAWRDRWASMFANRRHRGLALNQCRS